MEQLLNLGCAIISSDQVPARHYFLELLNTPEAIWGIRGLGVTAAILALFLYTKLKKAEMAAEVIVSGEGVVKQLVPDSALEPEESPVSDMYSMSDSVSEPEESPVSDTYPTSDSVSEPEESPVSDTYPTSDSISEPEESPMLDTYPTSDSVSEPEESPMLDTYPTSDLASTADSSSVVDSGHTSDPKPTLGDVPVPELTPKPKTVPRLARNPKVTLNKPKTGSQSNIWLWSLPVISLGGLVVLHVYYQNKKKRKKRKKDGRNVKGKKRRVT